MIKNINKGSFIKRILNDVNPLIKLEGQLKPMLKPVYFDSLGINLTGAKLIKTFEKNYLCMKVYSIIKKEFSIPLCSEYYMNLNFLVNLVGFNYMNGFKYRKLKKYGKSGVEMKIGFLGSHWDDEAN